MGAAETFIGGAFGMVVLLFLLVLAVLWFCLPFAVFGIKDRLDTLIRETKANTEVLHLVGRELERIRAQGMAPAGAAPAPTSTANLTLAEQMTQGGRHGAATLP